MLITAVKMARGYEDIRSLGFTSALMGQECALNVQAYASLALGLRVDARNAFALPDRQLVSHTSKLAQPTRHTLTPLQPLQLLNGRGDLESLISRDVTLEGASTHTLFAGTPTG